MLSWLLPTPCKYQTLHKGMLNTYCPFLEPHMPNFIQITCILSAIKVFPKSCHTNLEKKNSPRNPNPHSNRVTLYILTKIWFLKGNWTYFLNLEICYMLVYCPFKTNDNRFLPLSKWICFTISKMHEAISMCL